MDKTIRNTQKRHEFQVEIRKRANRQRLSNMRALLFSSNINPNSAAQDTKKILSQLNPENMTRSLTSLKMLSIQPEASAQMIPIINNFCEVALKAQPDSSQFEDVMTILINLSVFAEVTVPRQFYTEVAKMILTPQRQHLVYWLLANLLLRKNDQSKAIMQYLLKINVVDYIAKRVEKSFQQKTMFVIFNGFCCHLLSNSEDMPFGQYKSLLKTLQVIQEFNMEETDWELSYSLIDHAPFIKNQNYQLFSTKLFKKFLEYCRLKKSHLIKNYLNMILVFIQVDTDPESYERLKKYGVFTSFNYCLENRSHQVKRLCAQVGSTLITNFQEKIDLLAEDFYTSLGMETENIDKYQENTQQALLLFLEKLIFLSIERRAAKQLLKIIQKTQIGHQLTIIVKMQKEQIVSLCLRILQIVMPISHKIRKQCQSSGLFISLQKQNFNNPEIRTQVIDFLKENSQYVQNSEKQQ